MHAASGQAQVPRQAGAAQAATARQEAHGPPQRRGRGAAAAPERLVERQAATVPQEAPAEEVPPEARVKSRLEMLRDRIKFKEAEARRNQVV